MAHLFQGTCFSKIHLHDFASLGNNNKKDISASDKSWNSPNLRLPLYNRLSKLLSVNSVYGTISKPFKFPGGSLLQPMNKKRLVVWQSIHFSLMIEDEEHMSRCAYTHKHTHSHTHTQTHTHTCMHIHSISSPSNFHFFSMAPLLSSYWNSGSHFSRKVQI